MMGDDNSGSYPNIVISPFTHLERNFNSSATRKEINLCNQSIQ